MRGLHYLAFLLQHPNEEVHALRLVMGDVEMVEGGQSGKTSNLLGKHSALEPMVGFLDSGEVADSQTRTAYKQRLEDLQAEFEEASTYKDQGRVSKLQDEIDFLTQELARAVGLGEQGRRAGSPVERMRTTVTKALKNALKKIRDKHPPLGQYLTRTVKTGTCCSYAPDPRLPVSWRF
jgi:hypothetical protein